MTETSFQNTTYAGDQRCWLFLSTMRTNRDMKKKTFTMQKVEQIKSTQIKTYTLNNSKMYYFARLILTLQANSRINIVLLRSICDNKPQSPELWSFHNRVSYSTGIAQRYASRALASSEDSAGRGN